MRDGRLETSADHVELGIGLRVVHEGSFGFAATVELAPDAAAALAEEAVATARATALAVNERVELADEPSHGEAVWTSAYRLDPAEVPMADKVAVLEDWSGRLLASSAVDHVTAYVLAVVEDKHYANLSGTVTTQRRVRVHPVVETVAVDAESAGFETMRSVAPPAGRGWEYLLGEGWDWDEELARLPEYLAEKLHAPSVVPGSYDLVIDPSNLWLVIHESIGHATELDRALGYEAAFAGTSFATFDKLGTLRYGSEIMNVTGDRTVAHGLSTIGYDDEGVQAQQLRSHPRRRARRLPARPAHRTGERTRSLQRLRLCRFSHAHPHPTDGERLAASGRRNRPEHRRAHLIGRRRLLHRGRQELVDRHAALQLPVHRSAFFQNRKGKARRAGKGPGISVTNDGLLGSHASCGRRVDLPAGWGLQLWQGSAGPGRPC